MATHSTDLPQPLRRRPAVPSVTYDVRTTCIYTALSIVALVALLIALVYV